MATLAEIRAKLQAQSSKPQGEGQIGDNAIYPHWNIPENSEAVLRFLPDGNKAVSYTHLTLPTNREV